MRFFYREQMNIEALYKHYSVHYLVDTDTRNIRKNTLYFALTGANFNGNTFAEEAIAKGAAYSIVDQKEYATNAHCILVDDVLSTLQALASYHRSMLNIPIIGLTGSNGKTTTKELINAVLSQQFTTTATQGNLNNHIGVPLTLLSMTPATEIGIVEMGANHPYEIAFLADITKPDLGYVTNFGKAHLEGFGSIEGVIAAKSELYTQLKTDQKTVVVNPSDAIQVEKTKGMKVLSFDSDISFLTANPFVSIQFGTQQIDTQLIGDYNYANIAAAISIGRYFNVDTNAIKQGLMGYVPSNNRSQVMVSPKNNKLILDAYNANPTSMKVALSSFNDMAGTAKIVILGDMFELGATSAQEHQALADYCATLHFEQVLLVGKLFAQVASKHSTFESYEDLETHIQVCNFTNCNILIKGSRGMALERITSFL